MPLYDCMLLLKPHVKKEALMELVSRVGKHVYTKNGVVADIKSFGTVQLGYGIKKLDGKYYQAQLMQMTMMAPPSINSEMLRYLNKEDWLLHWLLVKHVTLNMDWNFLAKMMLKMNSPGSEATYTTMITLMRTKAMKTMKMNIKQRQRMSEKCCCEF